MGFVCLAAADARSAGDHTQGTYVCGAGLDILDANKRTTGNCVALASGAPPSGPLTLADAANTQINLPTPCADKGAYWDCRSATFTHPAAGGVLYCRTPPNKPVQLFLVKAALSNGGFNFTTPALTVACGGLNISGPPPPPACPIPAPEQYSAVDHCISWGYEPTTAPLEQRRFGACIRMVRADYLGNGKSATRPGIHIQPFTGIAGDVPECHINKPSCDGCLEASWDENGAQCIVHQRLQQEILRRIVVLAGVPRADAVADLRKKFPNSGSHLDCISGVDPEKHVSPALLTNRSRIHICASLTAPMQIKACHKILPDVCPPVSGYCP